MTPLDIIHAPSREAFIAAAADHALHAMSRAIDADGHALVGLSGGSTPIPVYESIGKADIDWSNVTFFPVDERYIAADSPLSNQRAIREALGMAASSLIASDTSLSLETCIERYNETLVQLLKKHPITLTVLGMGDDGHIASLFPPLGDAAFSEDALVLHTTTDRFDVHDRLTVTLPFLLRAREHMLLLNGEAKKRTWDEMMASDDDARRWPMKMMMDEGTVRVVMLY